MRQARRVPSAATARVFAALLAFVFAGAAPRAHAGAVCALDPPAFAGHQMPLQGSPDPQPMQLVNAFPQLSFASSVFLAAPPDGTDRLFVVERRGRIRVFENDAATDSSTLFLDIEPIVVSGGSEQGLLGLAFDPAYATNRRFYVNYITATGCGHPGNEPNCTKIVRYEADPNDPNLADSASATLIFEFPQFAPNHNGGMLAFGPDGMLYVGAGDGGGGNDPRNLARNLTSPLGSLLRLDVREGAASVIPADNPFVGQAGAAEAIFHYGLRNPWRFSFDRLSGDLWIGDVGQGAWEEVDHLPAGTPGGVDFGWDFCEGSFDVDGHDCSSIPGATPPVIEYPHNGQGGFSITGGYVYRGDEFPELYGAYLYTDYVSRRVWAWTGESGVEPEQIATAPTGISSFGEDRDGELYLVGLSGTIYRLQRSTGPGGVGATLPSLLSQTGFFSDVGSLTPAPGLVEYGVTTPLWSDNAAKQRWMALPAGEQVAFHASEPWGFPVGTAFVKHFGLPLDGGGERAVETRVFWRQIDRWLGVTYRWNGSDAELLTEGLDESIPLGTSSQDWHYPSATECLGCHTEVSGRVLGVRTRQHGGEFEHPGGSEVQVDAWNCAGLFDLDVRDASRYDAYAALEDSSASTLHRARSYLASNCAMCHQPGGPAPGSEDLRFDPVLGDMNLIGVAPTEGDLGISSPSRIAPGVKEDSVLWVRQASTDEVVRMARGTLLPDPAAVGLVGDWIDFDLGSLDSDEDGVEDASDLCPAVRDPLQQDSDLDGEGDACDPDQLPDLEIASVTLPIATHELAAVTLAATARNNGGGPAGDFPLLFHLSDDASLDPGIDPVVGHCWLEGLGQGAEASCSESEAVIPLVVAEGEPSARLHWIVCADRIGVVPEGDDSDNCTTLPITVPAPAGSRVALLVLAALVGLRRRAR